MRAYQTMLLQAVVLIAGGCASITTNEMQAVMVTTRLQDGKPVDQVDCTLTNHKGRWTVVSPGQVGVRRSADDMQVECAKEQVPKGMAKAISRAHGGMFGNIVFGGGIGALIDHNNGTGYDYPDQIDVVMGASIVTDRRDRPEAARQPGATGSEPPATAASPAVPSFGRQ